MSRYTVRLVERESHTLIEPVGEFYRHGSAEYEAQKASRRMSSPDVIAVMEWENSRGLPQRKTWRMGKVYREVPR